ncbi:MAG TPA: MFS transporter [Trebonia sp.]
MTQQTSGSDNVLTALDQQHPTRLYWQLTLLATLGGFLFGYDTSNIGSALNFVPYGLHGLALGYLVSGASLGAAAGAICAGPLADRFGRKWLLITDADRSPASTCRCTTGRTCSARSSPARTPLW